MVKRFDLEETGYYNDEIDHAMFERENGEWVRYDDYLILQAALKESLDRWMKWPLNKRSSKRLAVLRNLCE